MHSITYIIELHALNYVTKIIQKAYTTTKYLTAVKQI